MSTVIFTIRHFVKCLSMALEDIFNFIGCFTPDRGSLLLTNLFLPQDLDFITFFQPWVFSCECAVSDSIDPDI